MRENRQYTQVPKFTEASSGLHLLDRLAAMVSHCASVQFGHYLMQRAQLVIQILCHFLFRAWRSWPGRRVIRRAQNSSPPLLTQQSTPGGLYDPVTVVLQRQSNRLHRHTYRTQHVLDPKPDRGQATTLCRFEHHKMVAVG